MTSRRLKLLGGLTLAVGMLVLAVMASLLPMQRKSGSVSFWLARLTTGAGTPAEARHVLHVWRIEHVRGLVFPAWRETNIFGVVNLDRHLIVTEEFVARHSDPEFDSLFLEVLRREGDNVPDWNELARIGHLPDKEILWSGVIRTALVLYVPFIGISAIWFFVNRRRASGLVQSSGIDA